MENKKKIEKIISDYTARVPSKADELKALDKKVKTPPTAFAYSFGVIAALILGVGMCICLGVIADKLFALGVVVGVVGIGLCVANYFIYRAAMKKRRALYAEKVLALANQIGGDE